MRHKRDHDFYAEWLARTERRKSAWRTDQSHMHTSHFLLDRKIQHLRSEITNLADQDAMLFEQFFALEESIEELKAQMRLSEGSEGSCFSSLNSSTCSLASVREVNVCNRDQEPEVEDEDVFEPWTPEDSAGVFVRQRVSYPPISRNRCRRSQTTSGGQQKGNDDDEGVAGLEERVVLRRLFSLQERNAELKSDGGESSVSSLDSGICLPAFPAALQAMLDRAAASSSSANSAAEAEIFV